MTDPSGPEEILGKTGLKRLRIWLTIRIRIEMLIREMREARRRDRDPSFKTKETGSFHFFSTTGFPHDEDYPCMPSGLKRFPCPGEIYAFFFSFPGIGREGDAGTGKKDENMGETTTLSPFTGIEPLSV